jgi:multiple sugar transport system permease protein
MLKNLKRFIMRNWLAWFFLTPFALVFSAIVLIPAVQVLWVSLLDANKSNLGSYPVMPFQGLTHYKQLLGFQTDTPIFAEWTSALRNTFFFTLLVTLGSNIMGVAGAMLLHKKMAGWKWMRNGFLLSWIVPSYVVGILWGTMWAQNEGIINTLLFDILNFHRISEFWGWEWTYSDGSLVKPRWLSGENTLWALVVPAIWRFWPFCMILILAGMESVNDEYYEAAELDGCTPWQQFKYITLPLLKPVFVLLLLNSIILNTYSFNMIIMLFSSGSGGGMPGRFGDMILTNIFRNSFLMWNLGLGAAMSVILMVLMVIVIFFWHTMLRRGTKEPK